MESILTLPLKQREVVLHYYYHNMTLKEIAGALNITARYVGGKSLPVR